MFNIFHSQDAVLFKLKQMRDIDQDNSGKNGRDACKLGVSPKITVSVSMLVSIYGTCTRCHKLGPTKPTTKLVLVWTFGSHQDIKPCPHTQTHTHILSASVHYPFVKKNGSLRTETRSAHGRWQMYTSILSHQVYHHNI